MNYFIFPILNILVAHFVHFPLTQSRPLAIFAAFASAISDAFLHFMQYPVTIVRPPLISPEIVDV